MRWVTEITHIEHERYFVDEQRIGPYHMWHHEHHFKQLNSEQVEMTDQVTYILPMSPLGDLVHPWIVRPQLRRIFAFREEAVNRLFP